MLVLEEIVMLGDSLISHKLQNLKLQPKVRNALALDKHLQTCSFLNCQIFSCNTFYYVSAKWSKKSFQPNPIVPSQCLNRELENRSFPHTGLFKTQKSDTEGEKDDGTRVAERIWLEYPFNTGKRGGSKCHSRLQIQFKMLPHAY